MNGTIEFLLAGLIVLGQFLAELPDQQFLEKSNNQELAQAYSRSCLKMLDRMDLKTEDLEVLGQMMVDLTGDSRSPFSKMAFGQTSLSEAVDLMIGLCRPEPDAQLLAKYDFMKAVEIYRDLKRSLPDPRGLLDLQLPESTLLLDQQGRPIGDLFVKEGRREWVSLEQIPDHVQKAFISAEDKAFYEHEGVDSNGVLRAFVKSIMSNGRPQGGSTITQQVVKNLLVGDELSLERKFKEMLLAKRVETELWPDKATTKRRILEIYLNIVYQGRDSWGVGMSARAYFGKSVEDLSLSEAAFLAGINRGPNYYNPERYLKRALARRDYVLRRMREDGYISAQQEQSAKEVELPFVSSPFDRQAPYFVREVKESLQKNVDQGFDFGAGQRVKTTLNSDLQKVADQALREGLVEYEIESGRRKSWSGPLASLANALNEAQSAIAEEKARTEKLREAFQERRSSGLDSALDELGDGGTGITEDPVEGVESMDPASPEEEASADEPYWLSVFQSASLPGSPDDLNWQQALVLQTGDDGVQIGLRNGEVGRLDADSVKWAKGLQFGDVVFVAPAKSDGEYTLKQAPEVQGAIVVMDVHSGDILAMSGGFSFDLSPFNRATQAKRQPGSTMKPFTYMAALQQQIPPNALFSDTQHYFSPIRRGSKAWRPHNYDGRYLGTIPLRMGLEQSRNALTAGVMKRIGLDSVIETAVDFGVYDNPQPHYPFVLGAEETTLLRMVRAYAMIANGGIRVEPRFVKEVTEGSRTLYRDLGVAHGILSSVDRVTLTQIRSLLQGVLKRGTARRIRDLSHVVAGKTGTTSDYIDSWFVGFTQDIVVGVYAGYDNNKERRTLGRSGTGAGLALPIFEKVIRQSFEVYKKPRPFPEAPDHVSIEYVDASTGRMVSANQENAVQEYFRHGTIRREMYEAMAWDRVGTRYGLDDSYDSLDDYIYGQIAPRGQHGVTVHRPQERDGGQLAPVGPDRGQSRSYEPQPSQQGSYGDRRGQAGPSRDYERPRHHEPPQGSGRQSEPQRSGRLDPSSPVPLRPGQRNTRPGLERGRDLDRDSSQGPIRLVPRRQGADNERRRRPTPLLPPEGSRREEPRRERPARRERQAAPGGGAYNEAPPSARFDPRGGRRSTRDDD